MRGRLGGEGQAVSRRQQRRPGWSCDDGFFVCILVCVCEYVTLLTQSDATLIGDNGEVCLNRLDRREVNRSYGLWFCCFTDEAFKGIKLSTKHAQTGIHTQPEKDRKDNKLWVLKAPFRHAPHVHVLSKNIWSRWFHVKVFMVIVLLLTWYGKHFPVDVSTN